MSLETQWPLLLPYSNYRSKLTDEKLIRVSGIAEVEETGRSMLVLKDISLEPPHLSIEVGIWTQVGALRLSDSPSPGAGVQQPTRHCSHLIPHRWLQHSMVWSCALTSEWRGRA